MKTEFINEVFLKGVVTEVEREHFSDDLSYYRISMYTEHTYDVDSFTERTNHRVIVFPNLAESDSFIKGVIRGSIIKVRGRLHLGMRPGTVLLIPEIIATSLEVESKPEE